MTGCSVIWISVIRCLAFFFALVNPSGSEATLNVVFKWKKRATQGHRTQLYQNNNITTFKILFIQELSSRLIVSL